MRYNQFLPQNRRPKPEPPQPVPPPPPSAGARPMSPVQKAYYGISDKPKGTTPKRDGAGTTKGRKGSARNRRPRRVNVWRVAFSVLAAGLLFAGAGALVTHPGLNVKTVAVEGNHSIATQKILQSAGTIRGKNIVLLQTEKIRAAILKEPTFESVNVSRVLPDGIKITVQERQPWASLTTSDAQCFTMDKNLVPFRAPAVPEKDLPVVSLDTEAAKAGVTLGKALAISGVADIALCLDWARNQPDFPLASLEIAPDGKLCLNRIGGAQARLGSTFNLNRKLAALQLMLRQSDVRTREWEYINLFAYDGPAVKFKPVVPGKNFLDPAANVAAINDSGMASPIARNSAGGAELP